jgi:hypothetical protein
MADGATDLSELLGSGPVQNPSFPQSTTFAPIVSGGVDPFIAPMNTSVEKPVHSQSHSFNVIRHSVKNVMAYVGFFAAAMLISMSTPRSLILRYIPETYTAQGVPSYMGAAILAGVAVVVSYLFSVFTNSIL